MTALVVISWHLTISTKHAKWQQHSTTVVELLHNVDIITNHQLHQHQLSHHPPPKSEDRVSPPYCDGKTLSVLTRIQQFPRLPPTISVLYPTTVLTHDDHIQDLPNLSATAKNNTVMFDYN